MRLQSLFVLFMCCQQAAVCQENKAVDQLAIQFDKAYQSGKASHEGEGFYARMLEAAQAVFSPSNSVFITAIKEQKENTRLDSAITAVFFKATNNTVKKYNILEDTGQWLTRYEQFASVMADKLCTCLGTTISETEFEKKSQECGMKLNLDKTYASLAQQIRKELNIDEIILLAQMSFNRLYYTCPGTKNYFDRSVLYQSAYTLFFKTGDEVEQIGPRVLQWFREGKTDSVKKYFPSYQDFLPVLTLSSSAVKNYGAVSHGQLFTLENFGGAVHYQYFTEGYNSPRKSLLIGEIRFVTQGIYPAVTLKAIHYTRAADMPNREAIEKEQNNLPPPPPPPPPPPSTPPPGIKMEKVKG